MLADPAGRILTTPRRGRPANAGVPLVDLVAGVVFTMLERGPRNAYALGILEFVPTKNDPDSSIAVPLSPDFASEALILRPSRHPVPRRRLFSLPAPLPLP